MTPKQLEPYFRLIRLQHYGKRISPQIMVNFFGSLKDKDSCTLTSLVRKSGLKRLCCPVNSGHGGGAQASKWRNCFLSSLAPMLRPLLACVTPSHAECVCEIHVIVSLNSERAELRDAPAPAKANSPREARGSGQRLLILLRSLLRSLLSGEEDADP